MVLPSNPDNLPAVREKAAVKKALEGRFIVVQLCFRGLLFVGINVGLIQGAWIPHRFDAFVRSLYPITRTPKQLGTVLQR